MRGRGKISCKNALLFIEKQTAHSLAIDWICEALLQADSHDAVSQHVEHDTNELMSTEFPPFAELVSL